MIKVVKGETKIVYTLMILCITLEEKMPSQDCVTVHYFCHVNCFVFIYMSHFFLANIMWVCLSFDLIKLIFLQNLSNFCDFVSEVTLHCMSGDVTCSLVHDHSWMKSA